MDGIIKFNSKSKEGSILSNFKILPFIYNSNCTNKSTYYISGEHAFHGQKYICVGLKSNNDRRKELYEYANNFCGKNPVFSTPNDAKKGGGKNGKKLTDEEILYWNSIVDNIQKNICIHKSQQYEQIQEYIKINKNKYFLHQDNRATKNTIWGGKIKDGKLIGQNKLGKIWMEYANEL